jgi:hypothetical protein
LKVQRGTISQFGVVAAVGCVVRPGIPRPMPGVVIMPGIAVRSIIMVDMSNSFPELAFPARWS